LSAPHQLDERARSGFRQAFGYPPGAVAVAPGRINIIGEHTDYNQGFVLPAAIDRHIAVALRLRRDARVALRSDRYQAAVDMMAARGIEMAALETAQLCQAAENGFVGARTGIMDPFTALKARGGNAILLDCRSMQQEQVPLPDGRYAWLLADSRVRHELASSAYNERRRECEAAAAALGVRSLRDATDVDLERIANPVERRRAHHVVTENARVLQAAGALRRRSPRGLGPLLYASHESLRLDFAVSCRELDCLVELAAGMPQVIGARMMGGGFGGCALVLVESAGIDDVEQHLAEGYADEFHKSPEFYRVRSVDGVMTERAA